MSVAKKFVSFVSICVCLAGLIYQLEQISERYLKYPTRSEVKLSVPDHIVVPMLSTCWFLKDMFYRKPYSEKNATDNTSFTAYYEDLNRMSLNEIFEETTPVEYLFDTHPGCTVRKPDRLVARRPYSRRTCFKMFQIKKYVQKDFMCYKFSLSIIDPEQKLDQSEYSLTPQSSGLIYGLYLNSSVFARASYFTLFLHSSTTSDLHDSLFARSFEYKTRAGSRTIGVSHSGVSIVRLEAPYDTKCETFKPYLSGAEYLNDLLKWETVEKLGRVTTFNPIYSNQSDYPMITADLLANQTFLNEFKEIYNSYNKSFSDCYLHYYVSKIAINPSYTTSISVYWPQETEISLIHVPVYDYIDFLTYVLSSFGIWFGISVMSFGELINSVIDRCSNKQGDILHPDCKCKKLEKSNRQLRISMIAMLEYVDLRLDLLEK